jgi:NAD-specific glutamate dehydrogenase
VFLYHFDALISKIIFKKYKILFDIFLSKKYFERQLQPYFSNKLSSASTLVILIHPCKKNIYIQDKKKEKNKINPQGTIKLTWRVNTN